ncbi:hypothetical protein BH10PAT1_BH10PAT1_1800 [soil metagenome]
MSNLPKKEKFFSINEAANYLGVSTKTLRRWEASSVLNALRTSGGHRRYSITDLIQIRDKKKKNKNKVFAKDFAVAQKIETVDEIGSFKPAEEIIANNTYSNYAPAPEIYTPIQLHPDQKKVIKTISFAFMSFLLLFSISKVSTPLYAGITTQKENLIRSITGYYSDTYPIKIAQTINPNNNSKVLAAEVAAGSPVFNVNIISSFKESADFVKGLTSTDVATGTLEATGLTTISNNLSVSGDFISPSTIFNLLPTNVTTLNIGNTSTTTSISGTTGTTTINNNLTAKGSLEVLGDITKINGVTYSFPNTQGASSSTLTNDGSGTLTWSSVSGLTGTGTTNFIPKFTSASVLGDSLISDDGTTISISGDLTLIDGKKLDLSSITQTNNTNEGFILPVLNNTSDKPTSGTGYIAYNSGAGKPYFYDGANWVDFSGSTTSFIIAGDSGTNQTITDGQTLTFIGGTNITTATSNTNNVTISLDSHLAGPLALDLGSDATGDIYYRQAGGNLARLAVGGTGQTLGVVGGLPSWVGGSGGTGSSGFWDRVGTILSPTNTNDGLSLQPKNTNVGPGTSADGLTIAATGSTPSGGTNTENLINLSATALGSNVFNGVNFGTGLSNYVNGTNWVVTASGAETLQSSLTSVGVNSQSGLIQGTGGLTVTGATNINVTGTANSAIGNATGTFTLTSSGLNVNTGGDLTGVASIDTIATSATALTFAGAGTIDSGTTNALNLGTGNNAKTINIGTGNAGNIFNIGTNNTIADAINIGSILDTTTIRGLVSLTDIASGTGSSVCVDTSNNLITCTVGAGGITGTGLAGQVTFFNGATSVAGNNNFFWDSTNNLLGIGTNVPTSTLHINASYSDSAAAIFNQNDSGDIIAASKSGITKFRLDNSGNLLVAASDRLDTLTAGTLNIGTTTANAISIGNSGATTTLNGPVAIALGSDAIGDIYYRNSGGTLSRLGIGSTGQTLAVAGGLPSWAGGSGTGDAGFWTRTGTTLSPFNSGDNITTTGNISTTSTGTITSAGLLTGSAGITVPGGTANINVSGSSNTAIGNASGTFALLSTGLNVTTGGALTGVASIDTIATSATALTFAGAGTVDVTSAQLSLGTSGATSVSLGKSGVLTTNNGSLTSTQTLTASNGLTLSTGALNLTSTSGSSSLTSTATSGTSFAFINNSLSSTNGNLATFAFTNAASSGTVTENGLGIAAIGTATSGANTENLINLSSTALANNTFNGINFGTGLTNYINGTNWVVTAAGAETLNSTLTASGVNVTGLSINSAVYTDGSKNLTSTAPTSGALGYWSRTGTTLSPTTSGDAVTTSGNISTTSTGTITSAGLLTGSAGITVSGGTANINQSGTASTAIGNASGTFALVSTGLNVTTAGVLTIPAATGRLDTAAAGTLNLGTTTANNVTIGNITGAAQLNFNSGTGSQTFTSSVATTSTTSSAFVFTANSLTSGTGAYINSSSITTGDLFAINATGTTLTSGNLFNVMNNSSSVFAISGTQITANLPTQFTSAGDVGISYDLQFINPVASFIKSASNLNIQVGESFNSSDLTLTTFNSGNILLNTGTSTTGTGLVGIGPSVTPTALLHVSNRNESLPIGQALAIFDQGENQDILTASASGTTAFAIAKSGNLTTYSTTANADRLALVPQATGSNTYTGSITTADLTADRTYTLPDIGGTICVSGSTCASSGALGYWSRTGTTLSPSTANDIASISSNSATALLTLSPSGATGIGLAVGALSGATANTGISIGAITSAATATNFGINIGAITSQASATSASINTSGFAAGAGTATTGLILGANASTATTNKGIDIGALSGAGTTNLGINIGALSGATTSKGIAISTNSSATATGIDIGALSGGTANTGVKVGAISGSGTGIGVDIGAFTNTGATQYGVNIGAFSGTHNAGTTAGINIGNISSAGTTTKNYGIQLGTLTGGTTSNYQLQTGNVTSIASATNAQLVLGTTKATTGTAASSTNYGINILPLDSTGTINTAINIGTLSGATTAKGIAIGALSSATSTGIDIGALSGTTANLGLTVGAISGTGTTSAFNTGIISSTGATAQQINLGTITGANATSHSALTAGAISGTTATATGITLGTLTGGTTANYQVSTGAITSIASSTNYQLNLGTTAGAASATFGGINVGAISGAGTASYGINLGANTSTATNNYGINVGSISGGTNNYGILFANAPANGSIAAANNINLGLTTTGTGSQIFSSGVTTGSTTAGAFVFTANSLTTGTGGYFNSSTITTGDLLAINATGTTLTTGNLFNVMNNSSSVFNISGTQVATSLPAAFNAPGDVGIAYDLQFSNPTASYIKSKSPLYIAAGEVFNSSNLTLRTYNTGNILLDSGTSSTGTGLVGIGPSVTPTSLLYVSNTNESLPIGKSLAVFDQSESQDIITASNSGTTRFKINSAGNTFVTLRNTATFGVCHITNGAGFDELTDCSGSVGADYAEMYPVDANIDYGDIVSTSSTLVNEKETDGSGNIIQGQTRQVAKLSKTTTLHQNNVVGIVSNNYGDFSSTGNNIIDPNDNPKPVALNGRVPVKIASDSPDIAVGDFLTTSNQAGRATKATSAGRAIGMALEPWTPGNGKDTVLVFVNNTWYDPGTNNIAEATGSGQFDQLALMLKDSFTATDSGVIANVHEIDTTKLNVLGDTVLSDTVINGKLNVGTLTFDNVNQSINAVGVLKIQDLALGNIEFMNGLITFDTNGNVIAKSVTADKYKVAGTSAGTGTIVAGQTSIVIPTNEVKNSSLIFVTAQSATTKTLAVTTKTTGTSFKVEIPSADAHNINFSWWIVDKE